MHVLYMCTCMYGLELAHAVSGGCAYILSVAMDTCLALGPCLRHQSHRLIYKLHVYSVYAHTQSMCWPTRTHTHIE